MVLWAAGFDAETADKVHENGDKLKNLGVKQRGKLPIGKRFFILRNMHNISFQVATGPKNLWIKPLVLSTGFLSLCWLWF